MVCNGVLRQTEFDYVRSLHGRVTPAECCGPLLSLSIPRPRLDSLESAAQGEPVVTLLWASYTNGGLRTVDFQMCAAHWMDLSFIAGCLAKDHGKVDWFVAADTLLIQMCAVAGWDAKELANLLAWRRVPLN